MTTAFAFAVCQTGAEDALQAEVAHQQPGWRVAYRRPGLLTFKLPEGEALPLSGLTEAVAPRFGRVCGRSAGLVDSPEAALLRVRELLEGVAGPVRLQVAALEPGRPGEASEARVAEVSARAHAWQSDLAVAFSGAQVAVGGPATPGETVVDVLLEAPKRRPEGTRSVGGVGPEGTRSVGGVGPEGTDPLAEPEGALAERALVGIHVAGGVVLPAPGGTLGRPLPPEAPSWAWRKCEEALALTGFRTKAGQVAVELGAAPGGAVVSLLARGLAVTAVDPQPMDPRVAAFAEARRVPLTVLEAPMAAVPLESLPDRVDWLLVDAHLAGPVALKGLSRYVRWLLPRGLRGLLWTLKLHRWEDAARVDDLLGRLAALGFSEVGARQLPSNRQELLLWAATRDARRGR